MNLIPTLKQMLVLPFDRNLLVKFEGMVSKMEIVETDKDVIHAMKCKLKEMRTTHGMSTELLLIEKRKIEEEEAIFHGRVNRGPSNSLKVKSICKYQSRSLPNDNRFAYHIRKQTFQISQYSDSEIIYILGNQFNIEISKEYDRNKLNVQLKI